MFSPKHSLLALLVGIISLLLGLLRFGFLIQLISHPVIKSFIIASALLIALGQLKFLVDIPLNGNSIPEFVQSLVHYMPNADMASLIFGIASILFLIYLPKILNSQAVQGRIGSTNFIVKSVPLILVVISIALTVYFGLKDLGIKTVGEIPSGFPPVRIPHWNLDLALTLLPGAAMIAIAMLLFVDQVIP